MRNARFSCLVTGRILWLAVLAAAAACAGSGATGAPVGSSSEAAASGSRLDGDACPDPFLFAGLDQPTGNTRCILPRDVTIAAPILVDKADLTLDCGGRQILPAAAGVDGPTASAYAPSIPEVGIALMGAGRVTIKDCIIGAAERRIDFAVVLLGASGNHVLGNTLHVRAAGVTMGASTDNEIRDNAIDWDGSGDGIRCGRRSSRNLSAGNTLTSDGAPAKYVRHWPGTETEGGTLDVGVFNLDPYTLPLINVVVADRLVQLTNVGLPRVEDNRYEDNHVFLPGPHAGKNHGGIVAAVMSSRTVIRGNRVTGGRPGIRNAGFPVGTRVTFPGTCSGDPARSCVTDGDCAIPGIDATPKGTCGSIPPGQRADGRVWGATEEHNTLVGPFGTTADLALPCTSSATCVGSDPTGNVCLASGRCGCTASGDCPAGSVCLPGGVCAGNLDTAIALGASTIGALADGNDIAAAGTPFGITIAGDSINPAGNCSAPAGPCGPATVARNTVDGAGYGLALFAGALVFAASVTQNDITNSLIAGAGGIPNPGPYALPTELSVDGVGNYWGHDISPGYTSADADGNASVTDSNPFCQEVAALTGPLPATCP
jgi:hypothetical protein